MRIWKDIVGYNGKYQVSNNGDILSNNRNKPIMMSQTVGNHGYRSIRLCKNGTYIHKLVHRLVYETFIGEAKYIDHINGDKLDNRLENLRSCNMKQNTANSIKQSSTSSRFKGVCRHTKGWVSGIVVDNKRIHIGLFKEEIDAAKAYDKAAVKYFGEFAKTNKSMGLIENMSKDI